MASAAFSGVLWHLRQATFAADGVAYSDGELLDRFRLDRDEAAFAALVRRHGPMVFGVCRRTLRNQADAEDAFQATFLVLARRAHAVRPADRVGYWLYGVAYNTARKARTMNRRRVVRERRASLRERRDDFQSRQNSTCSELYDALDRELSRLPEKFRIAVVLCDLQGEPLKEVARRLECPTGTVASRLASARQILRSKLTLSCASGAAALAPAVARAHVPSRLTMLTARAAAGTLPASTHVLTLTEGVLHAMFLSKVKFALTAVVAASVLLAGLGNGIALLRADQEKAVKSGVDQKTDKPVKPVTDPTKPGEKPAKPGEKPSKPEGVKTPGISGTIKAVDAGKGRLTVSSPTKGGGTKEENVATDNETKVFLDGKEAALSDLKVGQPVAVKFNPDRTVALGVSVEGPAITGELKSVDQAKNTIEVKVNTHPDPTNKSKTVAEDKTYKVADDAHLMIPGQKKATLADLKAGNAVMVRISADGERAIAISTQVKAFGEGVSLFGELKTVDHDHKTIKVAVTVLADKTDKKSAKTEEKTIKLADDARVVVDGNKNSTLADLKAGSNVTIYMSKDGDKALAIVSSAKGGGDKKPEKPGVEKPSKAGDKPIK